MNKGSRWSGEGKKNKGRTSSGASKTKYSFSYAQKFSLLFSLYFGEIVIWWTQRENSWSPRVFSFSPPSNQTHFPTIFSLIVLSSFLSFPKSFHPNIPLVSNQGKLEKSFECGTFGKRCLTRGISAIAIILNEKS